MRQVYVKIALCSECFMNKPLYILLWSEFFAIHQSLANHKPWDLVCMCADTLVRTEIILWLHWDETTYQQSWRWVSWRLTSLLSSPSLPLVQCRSEATQWLCSCIDPHPQVRHCTETAWMCRLAPSPRVSPHSWSALCRQDCAIRFHPDPRKLFPGSVQWLACLSNARQRTRDQ